VRGLEVSYEPYSKISFRSYLKFKTPEDLARALTVQISPSVPASGTLRWANGILFNVNAFQPTDSAVKEYLSGTLNFDHLDFAVMQNYASDIKLPEKPLIVFGVINLTGHTLFDPLTKWIRSNLLKE
jgi:hypothetical protein